MILDPRNRRSGLTETGTSQRNPGVLHEARTRKPAPIPERDCRKGLYVQLTREEFLALDRALEVYRKGRGGAHASRQDLVRYWIAGGRFY